MIKITHDNRHEYSPIPGQDSKNLDHTSKRSHTFEVSHKAILPVSVLSTTINSEGMASLSTGLTINTQVQLEMVIVAIRCTNFYRNVRDYKMNEPIFSKELSTL